MKKILLLILALMMLLASCTDSPAVTASQMPSATATESPIASASPSPTPSPSPTLPPSPTPEPTPTPCVKLSNPDSVLSVRKGPGTNTEKLGTLKDGEPITIIERGDVWHKIAYNGGEAYVFAAYIKNAPVYYAYVPALTATVKGKKYVSEMVDVRSIVPDIKIWLTWASQDNVLKKVLYPAGACMLQRSTAEKLAKANEIFKKDGYRIRLYDGYRPYSVSEYLYKHVKNKKFVANPKRTPSTHNRGAAVDITLERIDTGEQIPMYSLMHTFNISSMRDLPDITQYEEGSPEYNAILKEYPDILKYDKRTRTAKKNVDYMTKVMKKCGFKTISTEWWHYNDTQRDKFMVLDYDLAKDVQWIPEAEYEAFMAEKAAEGPLTELPGYVVYPKPGSVDELDDDEG